MGARKRAYRPSEQKKKGRKIGGVGGGELKGGKRRTSTKMSDNHQKQVTRTEGAATPPCRGHARDKGGVWGGEDVLLPRREKGWEKNKHSPKTIEKGKKKGGAENFSGETGTLETIKVIIILGGKGTARMRRCQGKGPKGGGSQGTK